MVHSIRFSSLSVFRTNYIVPGMFFFLCPIFQWILFFYRFGRAFLPYVCIFPIRMSVQNRIECIALLSIACAHKMDTLSFYFSLFHFICPRDKYWRYFSKQNIWTSTTIPFDITIQILNVALFTAQLLQVIPNEMYRRCLQ